MQMNRIPFGITDWSKITPTEHKGETGVAIWRTCQFGGVRVRMMEYSPGYRADHWCWATSSSASRANYTPSCRTGGPLS